MFRATCLILCVFLLLTTPGCWDLREIEDLFIVQGIAVDRGETGNIRLLVQVINPAAVAGGGGGAMGNGGGQGRGLVTSFRNFAAEGMTVLHAFRELSHITSRELFYAHTEVVVVSEELARDKRFMEVIDFLDRSEQIRRQVWLLVARSNINELFGLVAPLQISPSERMAGIIEEKFRTEHFAASRLGDFLKYLQAEGMEAYTAGIVLQPNMSYIRSAPSSNEPDKEVAITNTAVFKGGRLAGWLTGTESRGLLWLRNEVRGGVVVVPCPGRKKGNGSITLNIIRADTRVEPEISADGSIRMLVRVKVQSNIEEVGCAIEINKPETLLAIEKAQNMAVAGEIRAALDKAQNEIGADVFGFGNAIFRSDPSFWRQVAPNWEEIFAGVEVDIKVESRVRRTGLVINPIQPR